ALSAEGVNVASIADAAANMSAAFVNVERLSPELAVAAAFVGTKPKRTMAPILIELLSPEHVIATDLAGAAQAHC
ncbi:hypothetical protein J3B02_005325, partial [Coemansia erecta]